LRACSSSEKRRTGGKIRKDAVTRDEKNCQRLPVQKGKRGEDLELARIERGGALKVELQNAFLSLEKKGEGKDNRRGKKVTALYQQRAGGGEDFDASRR